MKRPYKTPDQRIEEYRTKDKRYTVHAYHLALDAMGYADAHHPKGPRQNISPLEYVVAFRCLAHEEYGELAPLVLQKNEIRTTRDIGEITHALIQMGLFKKQATEDLRSFLEVPL